MGGYKVKNLTISILFIILLASTCFAHDPRGYIEYKDGKKIVRVHGTHYERGYAQGYLLGDEIIEIFSDYFLEYIFGNNAAIYNNTYYYFEQQFVVDDEFVTESEGILAGITAGGNSLYNTVLGRDVDVTDILLCNSIVDIADKRGQFLENELCSSIASWGTSTINSPELLGESIITRFLDWTPHQTLMDNHVIIVSIPEETDEQAWISFTFPGLFGCLSGINEAGVGSFYNVGNINTYNPADTFNPIFLSIRKGIESLDYDASGTCSPTDIVHAVNDDVQKTGSIMNVISSTSQDTFSLVIECNNTNGVTVRTEADNTIIPGDNLVATNHFRKLYPPTACYRYSNIADSLNNSTVINPERSWTLLSGAAGTYSNIQVIQYIPWSGKILWSTKTGSNAAYKEPPTSFTATELFEYVSIDVPEIPNQEMIVQKIYPLPIFNELSITLYSRERSMLSVNIFDVKGRLIKQKNLLIEVGNNTLLIPFDNEITSGIYFISFSGKTDLQTRKILVVR